MKSIGVPYSDADVAGAAADARAQGAEIATELAVDGVQVAADSDMVAIIAYVQSIGRKPAPAKPGSAVAQTR